MSTPAPGGGFSRPANEVCRQAPLSDPARGLASKPGSAAQLIAALVEQNLFLDACRVAAFALPKREAVWWACACVRQIQPAKGGNALTAAEKWVVSQSEDDRRAAHAAAEATGADSPAGCAAFAAFFSGGSLAPPGVPDVPPAESLTPTTVSGAVALAAVSGDPTKAAERFKKFLSLAQEVAAGKNRWPAK